MALVVGIVGKIASGKGVVSEYLVSKYGAKVYRFSDVLKDLLMRLNKPNTRENLQALGLHLRQVFGESVLADVLKDDVGKDAGRIVVVDGIRYWNEVEMVKSFKNSLIISITAPADVRYQRTISRATRGEASISIEQFRKNEESPTERMIDDIIKKSDVVIENIGSKESLLAAVDKALKGRLL